MGRFSGAAAGYIVWAEDRPSVNRKPDNLVVSTAGLEANSEFIECSEGEQTCDRANWQVAVLLPRIRDCQKFSGDADHPMLTSSGVSTSVAPLEAKYTDYLVVSIIPQRRL